MTLELISPPYFNEQFYADDEEGLRAYLSKKKITELNNRLRKIAQSDPKITLIDIRSEINNAEAKGYKVLYRDKLHYSSRGAKAVAALLKDELQNNSHGRLTDYV